MENRMQKKHIITLALFLISTFTYSSIDSINSLSHRATEKEIEYNTGLEFSKIKYITSSVDASLVGTAATNNTDHTSYEGNKTKWANNFTYGFTNLFSLCIGLDFDFVNSLITTADSTGATTHAPSTSIKTSTTFNALEMKNNGPEDVRIHSSYRYLNNNIKADLLVGIALSSKTKKAELNYNANNYYVVSKGDAMSGGSSIQIGTTVFGVIETFEWATNIGINYKLKKVGTIVGGDLNSSNTNLDYDKEINSKMDFKLNFTGQYNINPIFSISPSLGFDYISEEDASMSIYGGGTVLKPITTVDSAHTDITIALMGKFQVRDNLLVKLNYSHLFGGDIDGTVNMPTINTTDITHINDRTDNRFGLNLDFYF